MAEFISEAFAWYGVTDIALELGLGFLFLMFCWEGPYGLTFGQIRDSYFTGWGDKNALYQQAGQGAWAGTDSAHRIDGGWMVEGTFVSNEEAVAAAARRAPPTSAPVPEEDEFTGGPEADFSFSG
jgi:hypothetical protein